MSKKIVILAKKFWLNGERAYEILSVDALGWKELPEEYTHPSGDNEWFAYIRSDNGGLYINSYNNPDYTISPGDVFLKESFLAIHGMIKEAGKRLKRINDRIREEKRRAEWSGEVTFTI